MRIVLPRLARAALGLCRGPALDLCRVQPRHARATVQAKDFVARAVAVTPVAGHVLDPAYRKRPLPPSGRDRPGSEFVTVVVVDKFRVAQANMIEVSRGVECSRRFLGRARAMWGYDHHCTADPTILRSANTLRNHRSDTQRRCVADVPVHESTRRGESQSRRIARRPGARQTALGSWPHKRTHNSTREFGAVK